MPGLIRSALTYLAAAVALFTVVGAAAQTTVPLAQSPLLTLRTTPGLVMLNMSRDHRLFYAAYNDASDLDGDGVLEVGFKPAIAYYGYFDSNRCYEYNSSATPKRFDPTDVADSSTGCSTKTGKWHGNWLNWAMTSRLDSLRKVLYGGYRKVDDTTTVLEAANIPGDSHVWGKEYRPKQVIGFTGFDTSSEVNARNSRSAATPIYGDAVDSGYDIRYYTPLPTPDAGKMHIFLVKSEGDANSVYKDRQVPTFRVQANVDAMIDRVWIWSSSERPIGGPNGQFHFKRPAGCFTPQGMPGIQSCPGTATTFASYVPLTTLYPAANPILSTTKYAANDYGSATYAMEVRVQTCVSLGGSYESNCTGYPRSASTPTYYKPTGALHEYGETDSLKFGLITGSYTNNYSGGVVRKDVGSFTDEVNASNGRFYGPSTIKGIVNSINALTTYGFKGDSNYEYNCGFLFDKLRTQGQCHMWGAPVGEMMLEGLRYFADKGTGISAFTTGVSSSSSPDTRVGLPYVNSWKNPYRSKATGGSPICSRAVQMVIADPITSFDSDQLPGAAFSITTGYGNALSGGEGNLNPNDIALNVTTQADDIWDKEKLAGVSGKPNGTLYGLTSATEPKLFMGQTTLSNADGNPTAKLAAKFSEMRGHAPDETNTQGSYYSAAVAKFGREVGVQVNDGTNKATINVDHISVALGSVVPKIQFTYGGNTVSLVPFSKSVANGGTSLNTLSAPGTFQPTGLITLLYLDSQYNIPKLDPITRLPVLDSVGAPVLLNSDATVNGGRAYVRFMVSFSDMDQGGDNEADANLYYTMAINGAGGLDVTVQPYYQAGSIKQNMGYIISGTNADGVYLETTDETTTPIYFLDTRPGQTPFDPAAPRLNTTALTSVERTRTFTLGGGSGGRFVPKDPLWYAAKYGGAGEFDVNNDPTNYFKVTNPNNLPSQMGKAFKSAAALAAVASTSVVGVGQRSLGNAAIYQANYDSVTWTSRLYAFNVLGSGQVGSTIWEASAIVKPPVTRTNLYLGQGGATAPIQLVSGNYGLLDSSGSPSEQADFGNSPTFQYLMGDKPSEERNGGAYRNRGATNAVDFGSVIGDIVNSDPQIISRKDYGYGSTDTTYTTFLSTITTEQLAVASNSGFFHVFNASPTATGGGEIFGFMPQAARTNVKDLGAPTYQHRYFLDGAVGIGHAKIAVPGDATTDWRSVLVAAGGAGAKTVFAINTTSTTYSANSVLWEINSNTTLPTPGSLGNVMGRPAIGKLKNGTWVAIFGNGYNSKNTAGSGVGEATASILVVNLETGAIIKQIHVDEYFSNASFFGNGMGSTELVLSSSGTIEYVYGADFKGNIWRFDLSGTSVSSWPASAALIFSTPTGRPITAEIKIADSPNTTRTAGGKMIFFGTGSYLNSADATDTDVQALYGIYDDLYSTGNTSAAVKQSDLTVSSLSMAAPNDDTRITVGATDNWYATSDKLGWTLSLSGTNVAAGERVIAPPVRYTVAGKLDAFLFTSIVPGTDDCTSGVDAWITGVDALSGGYTKAFANSSNNSIKVVGGSPRGVFVLQDGPDPSLYISQTLFSGNVSTTYQSETGGVVTVTIGGTTGKTQILSVKLTPAVVAATGAAQVWRQLK